MPSAKSMFVRVSSLNGLSFKQADLIRRACLMIRGFTVNAFTIRRTVTNQSNTRTCPVRNKAIAVPVSSSASRKRKKSNLNNELPDHSETVSAAGYVKSLSVDWHSFTRASIKTLICNGWIPVAEGRQGRRDDSCHIKINAAASSGKV